MISFNLLSFAKEIAVKSEITINIILINSRFRILQKKKKKKRVLSFKVILKLIVNFRGLLWSQAFLVQTTHLLSVETATIYLLFKYYPVENRLEQRYFFKKELYMSYMVFLYKSGPIENP